MTSGGDRKRPPRVVVRRLELTADEVHAVLAALLRDLDDRRADAGDASVLRGVASRLA